MHYEDTIGSQGRRHLFVTPCVRLTCAKKEVFRIRNDFNAFPDPGLNINKNCHSMQVHKVQDPKPGYNVRFGSKIQMN
jgi:hypothetical protein